MLPVINEYELRVLGSLVEKHIATPDYYPMTLNALVNACNQKNHRDPVVSYDESIVNQALEGLKDKKLTYTFHGSESRVVKYGHLFPKAFDLNVDEVAVMCVLILRGPQTPGELRARTSHLYSFESLSEVESTIQKLTARDEPLIVKLPRQAGSRESRYAHLLGGEIDLDETAAGVDAALPQVTAKDTRIDRLEEEMGRLKVEINELRESLENFKSRFD